MTPADITAALPNGFHDAILQELRLDFARAEAVLTFDFLTGVPEAATEEGREARRSGVLRLTGLTGSAIEPSDATRRIAPRGGVMVDGDFGVLPESPEPPPDGLIRLWLFISSWNARMAFTASGVVLEW